MPGVINEAGHFDGPQTLVDGLLKAAVVDGHLASICQCPHLQGQVSLTLSNGQGTSEGLLGSIVVAFLLSQE